MLHAGQTRLGGASAGALLVACHHSGLSMELVTDACLKLATDCRSNGTRGRLGVRLMVAASPGEGASLHLAGLPDSDPLFREGVFQTALS